MFRFNFFADNAKIHNDEERMLELLGIARGRNRVCEHRFEFFAGREVLFETYPESDFTGYWISITEVTFTPKNFDKKLNQMLEVVAACFDHLPSIMLATGIYQLTDYYINDDVRRVSDFNKAVLLNFPFLFFRSGNKFGFHLAQRHGNVRYVVNKRKDVQDIFANPIKELMEDEGLSFEEAEKKASWDKKRRR